MLANTWSDPLSTYEQHHFVVRRPILELRHRSKSNTSPCGNQPAHISLTVNVDNDTFDTHHQQ